MAGLAGSTMTPLEDDPRVGDVVSARSAEVEIGILGFDLHRVDGGEALGAGEGAGEDAAWAIASSVPSHSPQYR